MTRNQSEFPLGFPRFSSGSLDPEVTSNNSSSSYIIRMKEYERERRLMERKQRIEKKQMAA
jgi:hypothetical protein